MLEQYLAAIEAGERDGQMKGGSSPGIEEFFVYDVGISLKFFFQHFRSILPHHPMQGISIAHALHKVPHFPAVMGLGRCWFLVEKQTKNDSLRIALFRDYYLSARIFQFLRDLETKFHAKTSGT